MTKILITGANGQLGTELRQLLDERQGLFMLIPIDFDQQKRGEIEFSHVSILCYIQTKRMKQLPLQFPAV